MRKNVKDVAASLHNNISHLTRYHYQEGMILSYHCNSRNTVVYEDECGNELSLQDLREKWPQMAASADRKET